MSTEIWKKIPEYDYEVSSYGRVRNISTNELLSSAGGIYPSVTLCSDNGQVKVFIHRLVAQAFIPNPLNLPMINHKDEDKRNNFVDNLEWCDAVYNATYSFGKVVQQLYKGEVIAEYASIHEAARAINGKDCQISRCCNKVKGCYKHRGFEWRFKEAE